MMIQRVTDPSRKTFGKRLYQHGLSEFSLLPVANLTLIQAPFSLISPNRGPILKGRDFWF